MINPFSIDFKEPRWLKQIFSFEDIKNFQTIVDAMKNHKKEIIINDYLDKKTILNLFYCVCSNYPLFYDFENLEKITYDSNKTIVEISYIKKYQSEQLKRKIIEKVNDIINKTNLNYLITDTDKEIAVNEWMVKNCKWHDGKDFNKYHSIIGMIEENRGVCISFALMTSLLLNCSGVECNVVTGRLKDHNFRTIQMPYELSNFFDKGKNTKIQFPIQNDQITMKNPIQYRDNINYNTNNWNTIYDNMKIPENHAWNVVYIENNERQIDVTFNRGVYWDSWMKTKHEFFNLTTEEIKEKRIIYFGPE